MPNSTMTRETLCPSLPTAAPAFRASGRTRWLGLAGRIVAGLLLVSTVGSAFMATSSAMAQEEEKKKKFRFGDPMPTLEGKWAGDVQPDWAEGKAYAILFWGSEAQASRKAFLQFWDIKDKYAGQINLVFFTSEKLDEATAYITNRGVKQELVPVGADVEKKGWNAWMKATGQSGDFALFIVDKKRRLVWGGDPGDIDLPRIVNLVLSDKYDPISEEKARPALEAARRAGKIRNYNESYMHYDTAIAVNPSLFTNIALEKYKFMLTEARDPKNGAAYGKSFLSSYGDNASALIDLAVMIVTDTDLKERDTALAEEAVKRVYAMSAPAPRPADPSILTRLATYQFATGKLKDAVELQMEAWMIAPESAKPAYKIKLDQFRNEAKKEAAKAGAGS
ncbi:MAG: hypothetical protein JNL80_00525 [Phycisphaerae bacterium]|jgi:hypothetical protein|nr:hypothetical protein [Phycisphaerae bacterium]